MIINTARPNGTPEGKKIEFFERIYEPETMKIIKEIIADVRAERIKLT